MQGVKFVFAAACQTLVSVCVLVAGACASGSQIQLSPGAASSLALYQAEHLRILAAVESVVEGNRAFAGWAHARSAHGIAFFDFDHTLADTRTLTPVRTLAGARRLDDSKCGRLAPGEEADYSVYSRRALFDTQPIESALGALRRARARGDLVFVITARSDRHNYASILDYLALRDAEPDAVLPINHAHFGDRLWKRFNTSGSGDKKTLLMAALIEIAQTRGAELERIEYHEDTDHYAIGAMQLLPAAFPDLRYEFFDYIRRSSGAGFVYMQSRIGAREPGINALWRDPRGRELAIESYDSGDCPR